MISCQAQVLGRDAVYGEQRLRECTLFFVSPPLSPPTHTAGG